MKSVKFEIKNEELKNVYKSIGKKKFDILFNDGIVEIKVKDFSHFKLVFHLVFSSVYCDDYLYIPIDENDIVGTYEMKEFIQKINSHGKIVSKLIDIIPLPVFIDSRIVQCQLTGIKIYKEYANYMSVSDFYTGVTNIIPFISESAVNIYTRTDVFFCDYCNSNFYNFDSNGEKISIKRGQLDVCPFCFKRTVLNYGLDEYDLEVGSSYYHFTDDELKDNGWTFINSYINNNVNVGLFLKMFSNLKILIRSYKDNANIFSIYVKE